MALMLECGPVGEATAALLKRICGPGLVDNLLAYSVES